MRLAGYSADRAGRLALLLEWLWEEFARKSKNTRQARGRFDEVFAGDPGETGWNPEGSGGLLFLPLATLFGPVGSV
jgi:hypothetical protein